VFDEWQKHYLERFKEVKNHLSELDNMIDIIIAIANNFNIAIPSISFSKKEIETKLLTLSKEILYSGIWLHPEDKITQKATQRALLNTPPSRKATIKDCVIYEHSIEFVSLLRSNAFSKKCTFMTSNTKDFCQKGSSIPKEPINVELKKISATLTTNWAWAVHELEL